MFLLPAYYWFSLIPQNGEMLLKYARFISNGGMIIAYCVPVLLLLLSFARGGRKRDGQAHPRQSASDQKEASTT
ncbi:hypothetical protein D3C73_1572050 [compost metagenome]